MNKKTSPDVHRVTALITLTGVVFYLFFQINKGGPFRDVNPFANDPYDAVGSFAFQGALLIGILTYARVLRLREAPEQATKTRLILRGNVLVLSAILNPAHSGLAARAIGNEWLWRQAAVDRRRL